MKKRADIKAEAFISMTEDIAIAIAIDTDSESVIS